MQQHFGSCIFVNAPVLNSDSKEVLHCAVVTQHWSLENQNVQNKGSACGWRRFEDETDWHSGCSEGCGIQATGILPQPWVMTVTKGVEKAATASIVWAHRSTESMHSGCETCLKIFFHPNWPETKWKMWWELCPQGTVLLQFQPTAVPWMYRQLWRRLLLC